MFTMDVSAHNVLLLFTTTFVLFNYNQLFIEIISSEQTCFALEKAMLLFEKYSSKYHCSAFKFIGIKTVLWVIN